MSINTISRNEVAAVRVLSLAEARVEVIIAKPQPFGEDFECRYQIVGVGDQKIRRMVGIDGLQALQLTLRTLAAEISKIRREHPGLSWEGDDSDTLGF